MRFAVFPTHLEWHFSVSAKKRLYSWNTMVFYSDLRLKKLCRLCTLCSSRNSSLLAKRKELWLSQAKFASALGVSVKMVSAKGPGKAVPDEAEQEKIEKLFALTDIKGIDL